MQKTIEMFIVTMVYKNFNKKFIKNGENLIVLQR
jgi:hypothetical protein